MKNSQSSALEKSVSGLAYSAAAMAVLFLTPQIIRWFRADVALYLGRDLDQSVAVIGSWLFVALAAIFAFFALAMMMQFLVRLLFRQSARRSDGF